MSLSELKMFELAENNYTECMYKGFDIAVSRDRHELSARIRLMLEVNSDLFLHIDTVMAGNMSELKEEIQHTINNVLCLTGAKMTKMYQNGEITIVDYNTGKYYFTKDQDKINAYHEYEKEQKAKKQITNAQQKIYVHVDKIVKIDNTTCVTFSKSNNHNDIRTIPIDHFNKLCQWHNKKYFIENCYEYQTMFDAYMNKENSKLEESNKTNDDIRSEVSLSFAIDYQLDDMLKCINCLNAIQISYDTEPLEHNKHIGMRGITFTNVTQKQYEIIIEMLKMNNIDYVSISQ